MGVSDTTEKDWDIHYAEMNAYNQALEDFVKEYHNHLCNENCGERKCVDDMDKCVYWFYANEVAKKLTKINTLSCLNLNKL